jgi:predicted short-subunit dehydrogenase-like oxidoreductase (DUF2520 family)
VAERSGRLGIGIIGAGRVGAVLGAALGGAGHAIVGASAVSERSLNRIDAMLPGVPVLEVPEVVRRSELVLIAIPADELSAFVEGLAAAGVWQPGQLVVHTAAEYGCGVLAPAQRAGAIPLALHPAMAFTGTSIDLGRLRDAYVAVTAPGPVQPIGQALVVEMGAEPVLVPESARPAYAEAVATASGFSAAIVAQAAGLLDAAGIEAPGRLLGPLVRSTMEIALRSVGASIDMSPGMQDDIDPEAL